MCIERVLAKMRLSFVIPCYRSEKTIFKVYEEISTTVRKKSTLYDFELIAVNDCSPDHVLEVLKKMAQDDKRVKVLDCAKNMGKHAALMAGFRYATGDYVLCVDDDCQCPVDRLWDLLTPLDDGFDVSIAKYGVKKQSKFKNMGSKVNDLMMTYMIGKPKDLQFANFIAMKKFVVEEILHYSGPYSYINGLILRTTNKIANVPMEERCRLEGTGGYTFKKSLKLWLNGFTAFSILPLRISIYLGMTFSVVGIVLSIITVIRKLLNPAILAGYTSIIASLIFIGGILMFMMGMLGEYVGRIYMCINNSPQYIVRQTWNIDTGFPCNN